MELILNTSSPDKKKKGAANIYTGYYDEDFNSHNYLLTYHNVVSGSFLVGDVNAMFMNSFMSTYKPELIYQRSQMNEGRQETKEIRYFVKKEKSVVSIVGNTYDYAAPFCVRIFHPGNKSMTPLIEFTKRYSAIPVKEAVNRVSLIVQNSGGGLSTTRYKIKMDDINVGMNYGERFLPVYNKVLTTLNKEESKGLVLFHGIPGSGKTSLIKHIAKQLTKEVIFVPPFLGESLSSPGFIPFLIEHKDSVLIIEDAERIISDRDGNKGSAGVSSILNITDGILGDCLNIQIIATFNTGRDNIDQALLRKGRLIADYNFDKLNISDSQRLINHLGKNHTAQNEMSLTDIYNIDEAEFKCETEKRQIGFLAK